jgi:hypothetical protein
MVVVCLLTGVLVIGAPAIGRWYIESRMLPRVGRRLGRTITAGAVSVGLGRLTLSRLVVTGDRDLKLPVVAVPEVRVDFSTGSLFTGKLRVNRAVLEQPRINLVRREDGSSNFLDMLRRGRGKKKKKVKGEGKIVVEHVHVRNGSLALDDQKESARLTVESVDGEVIRGGAARLVLGSVRLASPRVTSAVRFSKVLINKKPGQAAPEVTLRGGEVQVLPNLRLTGIKGTVVPQTKGGGSRITKVRIDLDGSYGGAEAKLWSATGWLGLDLAAGRLRVRAARFSLGRIKSILRPTPVIHPQRTMIFGRLDLSYEEQVLTFVGQLAVERLSLFHPRVARQPVLDLSGVAKLDGRLDRSRSTLTLNALDINSRGMEAKLSGAVERLGDKPHMSLRLQVPEVTCQQVVDAFPPSLIPRLQGFKVKGKFLLDLKADIDFADLDKLDLGGKVGYRRCKVVEAPEDMSAERLKQPFEHQVEATPRQFTVFTIGPENEDFAPYAIISPNIINAFLTTEDGGFYRHRGFIPSMFEKALSRNLKRGGFRLGASTITMQMVKNVLLTHEKTLSRKLQELFLSWYLEKELTKERIMEIYLNAIEFGPNIYGIGRATRHYFGKLPSEITPLEAAFFSSILPSPKRRYAHYCRGTLSDKWDRYVRRILRRMAGKGFVTESDMKAAETQVLTFNRNLEEETVKDCLDGVKDLVDGWYEARVQRLKEAISRWAPHQLDLFIPKPDSRKR